MGPSKRSMAVHANSAPWGQNALGGEITELENAARAEFLKTCSQLVRFHCFACIASGHRDWNDKNPREP